MRIIFYVLYPIALIYAFRGIKKPDNLIKDYRAKLAKRTRGWETPIQYTEKSISALVFNTISSIIN